MLRRRWFSSSSSAIRSERSLSGPGDGALGTEFRLANDHPRKRLIDVHAVKLFTVCVEPDHFVLTQEASDIVKLAGQFRLKAPQETIARQGHQWFAHNPLRRFDLCPNTIQQ